MKKQYRAKRDRYYTSHDTLDLYDNTEFHSDKSFSNINDAKIYERAVKHKLSRFDGFLVKSRVDKNPSMFGKKYKRKK